MGFMALCGCPVRKTVHCRFCAASLLCTQAVALENVPGLTDVACAVHILRALGCGVRGPHKGVVDVLPASEPGSTVPQEDMCAMRSSLFFLAPMLVRAGQACIGLPGGCKLGRAAH